MKGMGMKGGYKPAKMPAPAGAKPAHVPKSFGSHSNFKEPSSAKKLEGFKPPKM